MTRKKRPAFRKVLTEDNLKRLPVRRKQYMVWDGTSGRGAHDVVRGLGVLISPAGAKSYRSFYYFPGSPKAHSRHLGRVEEMTLVEARAACQEDRKRARAGIDPKADNPSLSNSYKAAVDDYIQRVQIDQNRNASAEEARRLLLRDCQDWHTLPIATITHVMIQKLLEHMRDGHDGRKPRPYLANALYARMRPFFAWCAKPTIGLITASPMIGIDKPFGNERRRDRAWFKGEAGDAAIGKLWTAADKLDPVTGRYLKTLLLTGKRKSALADMRWEHIDTGWFWDPPQSGQKNKRLHGVPLPDLAQRVLGPRKAAGFVFDGEQDGRIRRVDSERIAKATGIEDFFLHGIRHLMETKLAELRIAPHIRDMLLDHAPARGSGSAYDHHAYRDELLTALELWASHIEGLTTAAGVSRLR